LRLVAGSGVLVVFAAMTRWEPSVLRAAAMATCSMVSLAAGRPTAGLRALGLAGIGLLLADPFLLRSVGFQLSCAASAGIALFAPAVARRVPGPRWLRESVGVTVGAQAAVAPVMLAVFDGVPLISVPANVVAAPFAGPLTVLGLVGGVLGGVVRAPVLASVATLPAYVCASAVLVVARLAAAFPVMVRPEGAPFLLSAGAIGIVAAGAGRATWRRARARRPDARLVLPPR
jgi:competence protein ComEC